MSKTGGLFQLDVRKNFFREKSAYVESLIGTCSLLITEKRFLAAYEDYFNLSEILEIVHQTTGLL